MICPRWLVQSSAVGVAGFTLIALPLWMAPAPESTAADSPVVEVERTAVYHIEPIDFTDEQEFFGDDEPDEEDDFPNALLYPDEMTWEEGWTMTCGPPSAGWCVNGW